MEIIERLKNPDWWLDQCLSNLYLLCRNVLSTLEDPTPGFKDLHPPTHGRLANFVTQYARPGQKLLVLMPRGWVKSYIITVGWVIQRFLSNLLSGKREHIVISNATNPNAEEMLAKIKFNLQHNDFLRWILRSTLPKDCSKGFDTWTQGTIELRGNRIETASAEINLISRHFLIGVNDDLVNKDNSATPVQIMKVVDWWKLYQSLLHPQGLEFIVGTRYEEDDLYGHIIKSFLRPPEGHDNEPFFEWHQGRFHMLRVHCYEDREARKGSTFPTLFPDYKLREIEETQGDRFGGQYFNDPLSQTNRPFKAAWLNRIWMPQDIPPVRTTMMTVDPTGKEKAESDYTGVAITEAASDRNIYIRFADRKLVTDARLVDWIVELAMEYEPDLIGIEENKYSTLLDLMELYIPQMIRQGRVPKDKLQYVRTLPNLCIELRHRGRPKVLRIKNLTGWFESGRVLLAPTGMEHLREELLKFPGSRYFDIADALAYVLDVLVFPRPNDPEKVTLVPPELRMTAEERERAEWEALMGEKKRGETRGFLEEAALY